jgi:hypothetical protein
MDEQAALAELERLRDQVERYRAQRRSVNDEFDQFVRSFRSAPGDRRDAALPQRPRRKTMPDVEPPVPGDAPVSRSPVRRHFARDARILGGGALLLIVVAALVVWSLGADPPEAETAAGQTTAAVQQPLATAPSAPSATASELTTSRPVWVRVVADGKVVVERQLPANSRVPLEAQKTIVIRAGDAGAVRLRVRGQDQGALGGPGEVVTRRFDVPPRVSRTSG